LNHVWFEPLIDARMTKTYSRAGRWAEALERSAWLPATLLALCIARLWLVPLPSSFWVDELVTVFVVKHPGHASFAVAPQVPQSIYYWLPRAAQAVFGTSEIAYRAPSMLAMAVTLWLVARLAARLIHPRAGWFAVFAALSLRGIDYFALDARPYALGMAMAASSLYFLVRWLDTARWLDAAAFVVSAALVWRVHLLDWPMYLVMAGYAAVRLLRGGAVSGVRPAQWITVATATVVALIPSAISALRLSRGAQAHVFVLPPTLHVFEHELHWNVPLLCGAAAWLWVGLRRGAGSRRIARDEVRVSGWFLILGWWLCQPLCLYAYSQLTGNSVYVGRYLSPMLPGVALTATAVVARWLPSGQWRVAAAFMALGAFVFQGHLDSRLFRHDVSDWRAAAREVNRFAPDASTPVIVPSPFVEARPPAWTPDYPLPGFLYAQLDGYPIAGRALLFPFDSPGSSTQVSLEAVRYARGLAADGTLAATGKWAIYGPERHVRDWRNWFSQQPEFIGWRNSLYEYGDVYVAEFRRD
jgi:hypothetical protein